MTELVKSEEKIYFQAQQRYVTLGELKLTPKEKRAYEARSYPKVSDLLKTEEGEEQVKDLLRQYVLASEMFNGVKGSQSSQVVSTTIGLMLRVVENHQWVTIMELQETISEGLVGNLTDYLTLNPANLNKWLSVYRNSPERSLSIAKVGALEEKPKKRKLEAEYWADSLQDFFDVVQGISRMAVTDKERQEAAFFGLEKVSYISAIRKAMQEYKLFQISDEELEGLMSRYYSEIRAADGLGISEYFKVHGKESDYQNYQRNKFISAKALAPYAIKLATDIPATRKTLTFLFQKWIQPHFNHQNPRGK